MFEKEAEEYIKEHSFFDEEYGVLSLDVGSKIIFEDGAEFGYNKAKIEVEDSYRESLCNSELNLASVTEQLEELEKANEWHYVKDGLPKDNEYVLIYTDLNNCYVAKKVENHFMSKGWGFIPMSTVIAWKEIVLPKENE